MVVRELREVAPWKIAPPAASLTLAWAADDCSVDFPRSQFEMRPGEWM
jgi:hypothetical protein